MLKEMLMEIAVFVAIILCVVAVFAANADKFLVAIICGLIGAVLLGLVKYIDHIDYIRETKKDWWKRV